jgi:cation diffusion facilitator CzcD-associated flavoprotein CzcO
MAGRMNPLPPLHELADSAARVQALEARVTRELHAIAHPNQPWLVPHTGPDGLPALDVLIVGAGQSGGAVGFGLLRSQVSNILAIDAEPEGREGPWTTYARMHTLRSPKHFTGPDLDIPSLTCQLWFEARFGDSAWEALDMLPKGLCAEYLLWVRRITGVPVQSETRLLALAPVGDLIAATVQAHGQTRVIHARKVVLATGQESIGRWAMPASLQALPASHCAATPDAIDFNALRGKSVVVTGAGASAFDNAATALEAGATVHLLCRRLAPQVVQPYRWLTFRGFLRHLSDLDDPWRWRFMRYILGLREGFTQATYDRCAMQPAFHLHTDRAVTGSAMVRGRVQLQTTQGPLTTDFIISATGVDVDYAARPELANFADNIATWADRYTPPADEQDSRLAAFPYLASDYAFVERDAGRTPWITNVHLFAIGSTVSFGASGSSINALTTAVPKLVDGLTRGLFKGDLQRHWDSLQAYDVPQAILHPTAAQRAADVIPLERRA